MSVQCGAGTARQAIDSMSPVFTALMIPFLGTALGSAFLPVKGWILVIFMICLGISLKHIPGVPTEFFASFYCGLGPALVSAAYLFLARWIQAGKE